MTTTKTSGLGWTTFTVQDSSAVAQDIRTDISTLKISTPRAVQDITGIDKSAHERLLLLADSSISMNGYWDPGSNLAHEVFSTVPSTSVIRAISSVISSKTFGGNFLLTDYQLNRATGGAFTWTVPASLADGAVPTWS